MGLFGTASPFDTDIEKATDQNNTGENWAAILDICDKVKVTSNGPKDCLKSLTKRIHHSIPIVAMQALTVLDACVSNCGKEFHLEVASRDFEIEIRKLLNKNHPKISEKMKELLKKWAENEFKSDTQLSLIPSLYNKLKSEGNEFKGLQDQSKTQSFEASGSKKEEEDLAKAIELSLKENQGSPHNANTSSLYPSAISSSPVPVSKSKFKVKALYDFEAAEDNELTFKCGEIVDVLDDSDLNWWKGFNQRGEGLFPANFVTTNMNLSPESTPVHRKSVQFSEEVEVKTVELEPEPVTEIEETKMEKVLHLLHEADPSGERPDPPELSYLEDQVCSMGPLIDQELEKIDRKHAQLSRLTTELVDSLNMYHGLMREFPTPSPQHFSYKPTYHQGQPYPTSMSGPQGVMPNYPQSYPMPGNQMPYAPPHMIHYPQANAAAAPHMHVLPNSHMASLPVGMMEASVPRDSFPRGEMNMQPNIPQYGLPYNPQHPPFNQHPGAPQHPPLL